MRNRLRKLINNFLLFLAMFLLPLDGNRLNFNFLSYLNNLKVHMELPEWLVHWAPKLALQVRRSTRSSP